MLMSVAITDQLSSFKLAIEEISKEMCVILHLKIFQTLRGLKVKDDSGMCHKLRFLRNLDQR